MTKNNLLNKPIILSLLFMLILCLISIFFDGIFAILKINPNIVFTPVVWMISALFVGVIYTKVSGELLSKNKKIKTTLYSLFILLTLFLAIMSFMLELFDTTPFHLIVYSLSLVLPTLLIIISGVCIYPALGIGCKIATPDKFEITERSNLKDFLLIIFCFVLVVFFYKINAPVLNALKPHFYKQIEQTNLYSKKNEPVKIEKKYLQEGNSNGNELIINNEYNIKINEPTELDFLTKKQVFDLRKKYAAMNPAIIPANYAPSDTVFGQIQDGKHWWGFKGLIYKGSGEHGIDGLTKESLFINNPLLLIGVDSFWGFKDIEIDGPEIYIKPILITFEPSNKTIKVIYDYSGFKNNVIKFLSKANPPPKKLLNTTHFGFDCINARDFGYDYAYAYSGANIHFDNPKDSLLTGVHQLSDYLHVGNSCGYTGGCNNVSPYQEFLYFSLDKRSWFKKQIPAQISIKLWKQRPLNKNTKADLYYDVIFQ